MTIVEPAAGPSLAAARATMNVLPHDPFAANATMPPPAPWPGDSSSRLRLLDLAELLALDIKPRGMVLDPIIPERGMAMLYAARGIGKTHVALGIAHAVATGSRFLTWRAPRPRRVLLIDGEMPAVTLRERLQAIVAGS
ncbi:MAG: AAA family ATPase, partial [Hyphomicrobiales bacterium]|nr:AAA family ATPase [Hyphomicrobiales bacterium]